MIPQGALNSLNPTRKVKDLASDMIRSHDEQADKKEIYARLRARFQKLGLPARFIASPIASRTEAGIAVS